MHSYIPTERGSEIAEESGLRAMTDRLLAAKNLGSIVEGFVDSLHFTHDDAELSTDLIDEAWHVLGDDDRRQVQKGLSANADWRRVGSVPEGVLFDSPSLEKFTAATEIDNLVISGLVGWQFRNYRNSCKLLARNGFSEFGFENYMDATAFAGAYVVGRAANAERTKWGDTYKPPEYAYTDGGIHYRLSVGATLHGDMRMWSARSLIGGIIAPHQKAVEFSPEKTEMVAAYHSTEPDVTVAMMQWAYLQGGERQLEALLETFTEILELHSDGAGEISFQSGPFGDYGSGDTAMEIQPLELLMTEEDYQQRRLERGILSTAPYLPQSPIIFEIASSEAGLTFQNRDRKRPESEIQSQFAVPAEQFPYLFSLLIQQAQKGQGRTSPAQHIQLVQEAKILLADPHGWSESYYKRRRNY